MRRQVHSNKSLAEWRAARWSVRVCHPHLWRKLNLQAVGARAAAPTATTPTAAATGNAATTAADTAACCKCGMQRRHWCMHATRSPRVVAQRRRRLWAQCLASVALPVDDLTITTVEPLQLTKDYRVLHVITVNSRQIIVPARVDAAHRQRWQVCRSQKGSAARARVCGCHRPEQREREMSER